MRRLTQIFTLAILVSLPAASARASDALSDIHRLLSKNALICADFKQEKSLKVLTRPIVSKGRLVFVSGKGVLWQVREPYATQFLVKSDALIKWGDDGQPQRLSLGQAPVFRSLSQVFLAVFSGSTGSLKETFEILSRFNEGRWQLSLVPRDSDFAKIIARIGVTGQNYVEQIDIEEGRGDKTLIRFGNVKTEACQLDVVEKGYFAQ